MLDLTDHQDLLNINIKLSASPVITFEKVLSVSPELSALPSPVNEGHFSLYLDATLQYDSFSQVVNSYMAGKRFDLSEGLFATYIIVKEVSISGSNEGYLLIKVHFTGSFGGTVFLTAKPVYNPSNQIIEMQDINYDLQTKNLLLKGAKWLFAGKIETELKKISGIQLSSYFELAQNTLNEFLTKKWGKGIESSGTVNDLQLISAQALPQHLLIRTACEGNLAITLSEIDFRLKH